MINLPPADWKHIQVQMAAASKQSMHAGLLRDFLEILLWCLRVEKVRKNIIKLHYISIIPSFNFRETIAMFFLRLLIFSSTE